MKTANKLIASLSGNDYLNYELVPGVPIVEICGKERVLIENHKGIIGYSCCEIRVKVQNGCVCVCGRHLKLSKMSKTRLVITGGICGVTLQGR